MNKLILNFFGEEVTVETPKNLENLRKEIANKFCFSPSDAAEMLVSYFNEFKKTFIKTEEDFVDFIKKKIYKVDLDISPDSQLYKNSVLKIKEETEKDKKELEELIKIKEELKKKKGEFSDERSKQIKKLAKEIKELNRKRVKLIRETNKKKTKMTDQIKKTNQQIVDLQKKLGIPVTEEKKNPASAKLETKPNQDKKKTKKVYKKLLKQNAQKKLVKKAKEEKKADEKDMFTKVNETINKMVEKITKVVSEQLDKKTEEVEVEKKKIEESKIQLKEEEMKGLFNFASVSQNISEELNKWTKYVAQHTNELTNTLSEKYKNCVDVITSINKKEDKKEEVKEEKLRAPAPQTILTKIHKGIKCDGCGVYPIVGSRFKCALCQNFDYCERCEEKNKDSHLHPFIKIYSPEHANLDIQCELK
jgi:myosin heavy subunit